MKANILFALVACLAVILPSCHKTYTCGCEPYGQATGQVKAMSKKRALERCSSTCNGGKTVLL